VVCKHTDGNVLNVLQKVANLLQGVCKWNSFDLFYFGKGQNQSGVEIVCDVNSAYFERNMGKRKRLKFLLRELCCFARRLSAVCPCQ
jgi:hypothetical protein